MDKNYCIKCGKCCERIRVNFSEKKLYFDGIQYLDEKFANMLTEIERDGSISYCKCIYLKNNLCTNNNKPEICKHYPSSPFAYITEDCGYSGIVFINSEKVKQKIRKLKEEIIRYETLIQTNNNKREQQQFYKVIHRYKKYIEQYSEYGADNW